MKRKKKEEEIEKEQKQDSKSKRHTEELLKHFPDLPKDEICYAKHTTTHGLQLLNGHLWVAMKHVCFTGGVLIAKDNIILPYKDIKKISKKHSLGVIPNSIKIYMIDGKEYTFGNLIHQDAVYQELIEHWEKWKK